MKRRTAIKSLAALVELKSLSDITVGMSEDE